MPHRNLAVELLQKLLRGELATRRRKNLVQARSFAETGGPPFGGVGDRLKLDASPAGQGTAESG